MQSTRLGSDMRTLFEHHRIALITAFVVGLITVAPSLLAPRTLGAEYKGMLFAPLNDKNFSSGIMHDVLDGHPFPTSPFVYEYKDSAPLVIAPFSYWIYALPALVIGLSSTIILSKFLFPALLFFLVYLLTRWLAKEEAGGSDITLTSLAAGLLVVFGYEFLNYHYLVPALLGQTPAIPPVWTRPVNPIIGVIEAFAFLLLLNRLWLQHTSWKVILGGGIVLALSVSYYFSFGILMAIGSSLAGVALIRKEFAILRALVYVAGIGIALDAWYWWGVFSSLGADSLTATRNGMFSTHAPHVNTLLLLSTLVVGVLFLFSYVWKKERTHAREWLFIACLLAGSWIAFNEQVLTGREIWYHHFVQFTIPLSMISVLIAAYVAVRPLVPRLFRFALYFLCVATLVYGLFSVTSYRSHTDDLALEQSYAPLITWLLQHAPRDCAVFVNENELGGDYTPQLLIPAYTQCNVYNPPPSEFVPSDRLLHNYFLRLRMSGIEPAELHPYLMAHEQEVRATFFDTWERQTPVGQDAWLLRTIDWLVAKYPAFYAGDLKSQMLTYRMDYIASPTPLSASLYALLPGLKQLDTAGGYNIYSF